MRTEKEIERLLKAFKCAWLLVMNEVSDEKEREIAEAVVYGAEDIIEERDWPFVDAGVEESEMDLFIEAFKRFVSYLEKRYNIE